MDSLRIMDCIVRCVVCLKVSLSDLRRQLLLAEEPLKRSSMMKVHVVPWCIAVLFDVIITE